jgi:hypothetical protein
MKNSITKLFLAFFIITLSIGINSCKKDSTDETTTPPTKTELLTASSWKITAQTISPAIDTLGSLKTDLYAITEACSQDDLYNFNASGTYSFEEGATKCSPTADQIWDSGTWAFNGDETQITTLSSEVGSTTVTFNLIELTATKIKTTESLVKNSVTYTITTTFSH